MSSAQDTPAIPPLRQIVDDITAELSAAFPEIEPDRVRGIVAHAAVEFGGAPRQLLLRRVRQRASAQLAAMIGQLTPIRPHGTTGPPSH